MRLPTAVGLLGVLALCSASCSSGGDGGTGPSTGSLIVSITGLPAGTAASVTVSGPGGFSRTLTISETLSSLTPGAYTVTSVSVTAPAGSYASTPSTQTVNVAAGSTAATASVQYALATGSLTVTITGLPDAAIAATAAYATDASAVVDASVTVTGPNNYSRTLTATQTLVGLAPGTYTVTAAVVTAGENRYAASQSSQTVAVAVGTTAATAAVTYAIASGRLTVTVAGVTQGNVTVTGPGGFTRTLTGTTTLVLLTPGSYTITAADASAGGFTYRASQATQTIQVAASTTAGSATVTYAAIDGALAVSISGLPNGVSSAVTVTGPAGFSRVLATTSTITALPPGIYTISAANVTTGSTTYAVAQPTQTATVTIGATASASVAYAALAPVALRLASVLTGLARPVALTAPPGDARLFIVEQAGRIRIVKNGQLVTQSFLDIVSRVSQPTPDADERGALGLAFHPQYATNGFFFVYYTNLVGDIVVERFQVTANPDVASATGTVVITIPHGQDADHNGGGIVFGPDGYLYLGVGDGGCCYDPFLNGQNRNVLLGKLLRIDVNTLPYTIPAGNPFAGQTGRRGEIWAYGLRNPWRFDFDATTGTLYIADVGEDTFEEVDAVATTQAGLNFGWSLMEGPQCVVPGCSMQGITLPVLSYTHSQACSVTGGYVYRGSAISEIAGQYFYSDFCSGFLRSFLLANGVATQQRDWGIAFPGLVTSFGEDGAGELYMLMVSGSVFKIVRQ